MKTLRNKQSLLNASLALVIVAASGLANAAPEKIEKRDKDVLRGPNVTTTQPTKHRDSMDSMSDKMKSADKRASLPVTFRDYLAALRQLKGSQSLELSKTQREQIKSIMKHHREAMEEFREQHEDLYEAVKKNGRKPLSSSANSKTKDGASTSENKKSGPDKATIQARKKLRQLVDNSPENAQAISNLMQILSPEQQSLLKKQVVVVRTKQAQRAQRPDQEKRQRPDNSENKRPPSARTQRKHIDDADASKTKRANKDRSKKRKPAKKDD